MLRKMKLILSNKHEYISLQHHQMSQNVYFRITPVTRLNQLQQDQDYDDLCMGSE